MSEKKLKRYIALLVFIEEMEKTLVEDVEDGITTFKYRIFIRSLMNEKNLDYKFIEYITLNVLYAKDYDQGLEGIARIFVDFTGKININIIRYNSRYKNCEINSSSILKYDKLVCRYGDSATYEEIEKGETDFYTKIIDRNLELFNIKFLSSKSNKKLNEYASRFISNRLYVSFDKILKRYDELFTGDITEKDYEKSGYNKFISDSLKLANIPKLYEEAKRHPSFKSLEDFESVNNNVIFKSVDEKKKHKISDSFMSEYLIFLLLLQGKMLFNLETFIHDVSREIQQRNGGRGKNRLVDFRIIYKNQRVGIHVKRYFKGRKLKANISNEFDFDEDDMRISYLNVITLFDENLKWDYNSYIRETKIENNKKFNKNDKEKFRRIDRIVVAGVDERFLNGSKEEQIKFFNSLLED